LPRFVIFLCFLLPRCSVALHDNYDESNGMWGETDDDKKWKSMSRASQVPAALKDIPKERKPASC
jgi:hypothetical protein